MAVGLIVADLVRMQDRLVDQPEPHQGEGGGQQQVTDALPLVTAGLAKVEPDLVALDVAEAFLDRHPPAVEADDSIGPAEGARSREAASSTRNRRACICGQPAKRSISLCLVAPTIAIFDSLPRALPDCLRLGGGAKVGGGVLACLNRGRGRHTNAPRSPISRLGFINRPLCGVWRREYLTL